MQANQAMPSRSVRDEFERVYRDAVKLFETHPPSISTIERNLRPGCFVAARVMARMEAEKLVSEPVRDGTRQWFGKGAKGRAAFEAYAEKLRAGIEPSAHWWKNLTQPQRERVLPGAGASFSDLSRRDAATVRAAYWRAKDRLRALQKQFEHEHGWAFIAGGGA